VRAAPAPRASELAALEEMFVRFRRASRESPPISRPQRKEALAGVIEMTRAHGAAIADAIAADFGGRSLFETQFSELFPIMASARHALHHLRRWMQKRSVATAIYMWPGGNHLIRQPLGVVGIISPWNYPYFLTLGPAIGALAAGNRVLLKPSEIVPAFSELLKSLLPRYVPEEICAVVTGDVAVGQRFAQLPFDHLLFTGSTRVGVDIARAAAENLTPVTLELGGKSPALVASDADLVLAARRIVAGKLMNAGQTCVAPDYVIVDASVHSALLQALREAARSMDRSWPGPQDRTSIVTTHHYTRLLALIEDARRLGATVDVPIGSLEARPDRRMPLALLDGCTSEMRVMREEIFGPLLPVVSAESITQAIGDLRLEARPLAAYVFSRSANTRRRLVGGLTVGGITANGTLWHVGQESQPFGGVGSSGMGAYHGEHGFRTFSKEVPVFTEPTMSPMALFRPPYSRVASRVIRILMRLWS